MDKNLDIVVLIDKSASTLKTDCPGGKSRWAYMQETALGIAHHAAKFDPDGITVIPFAGSFKVHDGVTPGKVEQVFAEHEPAGSTALHLPLIHQFDAYFARKGAGAAKRTCLLVFTDGEPDDQSLVEKAIIDATKKMDADEELAVSFIQVGQDAAATAFLKRLDDELVAKGAKFDIVDTVPIAEAEGLTTEQLIEKAFAD